MQETNPSSRCEVIIQTIHFCKTTKPRGEVSVRNLHRSSCCAFQGLGVWLQQQLSKFLQLQHLAQLAEVVSVLAKQDQVGQESQACARRHQRAVLCGQLLELADGAFKAFEEDEGTRKAVVKEVVKRFSGRSMSRRPIRCTESPRDWHGFARKCTYSGPMLRFRSREEMVGVKE